MDMNNIGKFQMREIDHQQHIACNPLYLLAPVPLDALRYPLRYPLFHLIPDLRWNRKDEDIIFPHNSRAVKHRF